MKNFERMNIGSEVSKVSMLKKVIAPVVAFLALTGAGCTNSNEQSDIGKYDKDKVEGVESIELCDGARIRKDPIVRNGDNGEDANNTIHRVDFGDAPDGTCIEFEVNGDVYKTFQNPNNGYWIGLPYSDMSDMINGFEEKGADKIAWINQAKAGIDTVDTGK